MPPSSRSRRLPGRCELEQELPAEEDRLQELFLEQEEDDEEQASLADVLAGMAVKWPGIRGPKPNDIANLINSQSDYITEADLQLGIMLQGVPVPGAGVRPNRIGQGCREAAEQAYR